MTRPPPAATPDTLDFLMRTLLSFAMIAVLAILPSLSKASVFNVSNTSCTGAMTFLFTSVVSLDCQGSLTLDGGASGGTLSADTQLNLSALDSLYLSNLYIAAPAITLTAGSSITVGSNTSLNGWSTLTINSGNIGNFTLGPAIIAIPMPPVGTGTVILSSSPSNGSTVVASPLSLGPYIPPPALSIASSGTLTSSSSGTIISYYGNYVLPVPEPGIYATMLAGLLTLAGVAGFKRRWNVEAPQTAGA